MNNGSIFVHRELCISYQARDRCSPWPITGLLEREPRPAPSQNSPATGLLKTAGVWEQPPTGTLATSSTFSTRTRLDVQEAKDLDDGAPNPWIPASVRSDPLWALGLGRWKMQRERGVFFPSPWEDTVGLDSVLEDFCSCIQMLMFSFNK